MNDLFHPLVAGWFQSRFAAPSDAQREGWPLIASGRDTLIAAPTGSGKTLAAFLWAVDGLVRDAAAGTLRDEVRVVYVSPLRALSNDVQRNLQTPLREISEAGRLPEIRVEVRTGDTPQKMRERLVRTPPHLLITTPESLYILLTARRSREALQTARCVIVDEIHAVAADKRGTHLALSLERLDLAAGRPLQRIGLSATQKPLERVARLLIGAGRGDCAIVDAGHQRRMKLSIELPELEMSAVATHEMWDEIYDRLCARIAAHRTTIVFVNTRRLVERVAHQLSTRLGEQAVAAHHGSLSRQARLDAEQRLKSGEISVIVATASLELGIDVGTVDLVCHIGAPRAVSTLLQRVGRAGHWLGAVPRGVIFPLTRDELVQSLAAVRAVRSGVLDQLMVPEGALDVLAQQIVALVAGEAGDDGVAEDAVFDTVRRAWPYRSLPRETFDEIVAMLAQGTNSRKGRRGAWLHHDRVNHRLWARRGARMTAITSGGAIPDTADYDVIESPGELFVGRLTEDYALESAAGDVFLLGNRPWRIRRVTAGKVYVEDAHGLSPSIPFWLGEAPARTLELSEEVSELRRGVASRDAGEAVDWLMAETDCERSAAEQVVAYLAETRRALGCIPTGECIVAERFFDESGGMQLVLHAPFGGRINRAWGLALRKRFCVTFDFELQAAATDDGLVLSLGEQHSFPLETVFGYVRKRTLREDLVAAVIPSPMFTNRWRWNAARSLALPRFQGGRRVPVSIQRMRAEDLLSAVAPDATACQDNRSGPVDLGDHPLIRETLHDCLHEAMDVDGLEALLTRIERGEVACVAVETPAPSPMSAELLNASPYAFLDDAPLEERRARAVSMRRGDPALARSAGALGAEAIEEVRAQAWPVVRTPNDLHDLLLGLVLLPVTEAARWPHAVEALLAAGRALVLGDAYLVAAERVAAARFIAPHEPAATRSPSPGAAPTVAREQPALPPVPGDPRTLEEAITAAVHGWMNVLGPVTASQLSQRCGLDRALVQAGLIHLEAGGVVLQGYFTAGEAPRDVEWCERGLLARIHRLTLGRLRREIEPVSAADFIRFLLRWQHVMPSTRLHGPDGVLEVVGQLQGLDLPAPAWEERVLPIRLAPYAPVDLESLCLAGAVVWGRMRDGPTAPGRGAAIGFALRQDLPMLIAADEGAPPPGWGTRPSSDHPPSRVDSDGLSEAAAAVFDALRTRGALFLGDLARVCQRSTRVTEEALWELVARGLVSGDGVAGLRRLLRTRPAPAPTGLRAVDGGRAVGRLLPLGRWFPWRAGVVSESGGDVVAFWAEQLLRRYGVVFREVVAREAQAPAWRLLLGAWRRMEAQGRIRGGRFVGAFMGEQYALPEAVEALRAVRRASGAEEVVRVSAADPLNLVGILTPGPRLSPYSGQGIVYRNGIPVELGRAEAQPATPTG